MISPWTASAQEDLVFNQPEATSQYTGNHTLI